MNMFLYCLRFLNFLMIFGIALLYHVVYPNLSFPETFGLSILTYMFAREERRDWNEFLEEAQCSNQNKTS